MITNTVMQVNLTPQGDWGIVCRAVDSTIQDVEGDTWNHEYRIRPLALHIRAAEYGIDPTDADTALSVYLHEFYMLDNTPDNPTFVYAVDAKTALAAHLARVETAKHSANFLDPSKLLDRVKKMHLALIDPAFIDHHTKRAELHRAQFQAARAQVRSMA